MFEISPIPAFDDNYIWLLRDPDLRRYCPQGLQATDMVVMVMGN